MKNVVVKIECGGKCRRKRPKAKRFFVMRWHIGAQSFVEGKMARITNEQQVKVSVAPKTAAGNPAKIDGPVAFTSSDDTVAVIVTVPEHNAAIVRAVGPGVAQITAVFDADLDADEVREVTMTGAIEVVEAEAVTAEIVFDAPELIPAP